MALDHYISSILEQLKGAENYEQVDQVLAASFQQLAMKKYLATNYITGMKKSLEETSPLKLSSTQFSCFRYALISLRKISKDIEAGISGS